MGWWPGGDEYPVSDWTAADSWWFLLALIHQTSVRICLTHINTEGCGCRPDPQRAGLAALTAAALGVGPPRTFVRFDLARPLPLRLAYAGQVYALQAQRASLAQAHRAVQAFAAGSGASWLYLCGPCGSGKSHLAEAAYHARAEDGALLVRAPALLAYLRAGVEAGSLEARLAAVHQVPLLMLDDLGVERPTSWGLARLYDLLDTRSAHARPTLITSNLALDALCPTDADGAEQLAYARLSSRIAQHLARPLLLVAGDYRRNHWEETR